MSVKRVPGKVRAEHLKCNRAAWETGIAASNKQDGNKYLDDQEACEAIRYGRRDTLDYNGCEVIALYNLLIALGKPADLPELIAHFEKRGIAWGGAYGTSPRAILKFLRKRGFHYELLLREKANDEHLVAMEDRFEAFIFVTYNDPNNLDEYVHTMCITKEQYETCEKEPEKIGYKIHNDLEGNKQYASLKEALLGYRGGKSAWICVIGVERK